MPEIEVTEDQRERIRELEEELAEMVVGKYGTVRPRDAVEYLLDRYEYDGRVVSDVVEENGGSTAHDGEKRSDGTASDGEDAAEADDGEGEDDGEETDGDGDGESESDGDAAESEESESDDGEDETDADADGGEQMLNAMMNLLDEHDDKWGEGSGDDRYEVELPDGETEAVRTKDDVRALLFKHYR